MFVKIYKYTIRAVDRAKWEQLTNAVNTIYTTYGAKKLERLVRSMGDEIEVMEINYYDSRAAFQQVSAKVNRDAGISKLFREFKKLVKGTVVEEEYEMM